VTTALPFPELLPLRAVTVFLSTALRFFLVPSNTSSVPHPASSSHRSVLVDHFFYPFFFPGVPFFTKTFSLFLFTLFRFFFCCSLYLTTEVVASNS